MASREASYLDRLASFIRSHPFATAAAILAATGGTLLLYTILAPPPPVFKDDDGPRARFSDDTRLPRHMQQLVRAVSRMDSTPSPAEDDGASIVFDQLVSAVRSLHGEGLLTVGEASLLGSNFAGLARTSSVGGRDLNQLQLSRSQCRFVLGKVGVTDAAVADSIFDAWNSDASAEGIDVKEFMHAVVLVLRGSPSQKLDMLASIMDLDGDGWISRAEMTRFLATVYSSSGQVRTMDSITAQVERMFEHFGVKRRGFLSRAEFQSLAHDAKFHVGETLTKFLHDLTAKFSDSMGSAAQEYTASRRQEKDEDEDELEAADLDHRPAAVRTVKRDSSVYK